MYVQDLSKEEISKLKKIASTRKYPMLYALFRRMGLAGSPEEKNQVAKYDYKLRKFIKSVYP